MTACTAGAFPAAPQERPCRHDGGASDCWLRRRGPGVWEPDPYAGHPLNIWSNLPAAILAKCRPGIHQTRLFVLRTGWASMGRVRIHGSLLDVHRAFSDAHMAPGRPDCVTEALPWLSQLQISPRTSMTVTVSSILEKASLKIQADAGGGMRIHWTLKVSPPMTLSTTEADRHHRSPTAL